jgi:hypothetical protein
MLIPKWDTPGLFNTSAKIPTDVEKNDLALKVPPLKGLFRVHQKDEFGLSGSEFHDTTGRFPFSQQSPLSRAGYPSLYYPL